MSHPRLLLALLALAPAVAPAQPAAPTSAPAAAANPWPLPTLDTRPHPAAGTPADPVTYPDAEAFRARAARVAAVLAKEDLGKWRRGYFAGGDPGKYLPGPAMARLLLDPADPEARRYMNDDRSPREHYHFAAINWARFLPLFGDALTPETRALLAERAAKFSDYLKPSGTENHRLMNLAAANVLPAYLEGGHLAGRDRGDALREAKRQLRAFVKGLYTAGQGEWDSPTYLMFGLHGLLNVYDFAPDAETRLLAAAGLDFYAAGYALKYRNGLYTGPNQRGYYDHAYASIADQTGWLWWAGSPTEPADESLRGAVYAMHPATSAWRPNAVLTRLALKQVSGLPATQLNTKPNYWYGQNQPPRAGDYFETLHVAPSFTLGSIWNGFGSQITRFHLVAKGLEGPVAITGGHPRKSDHTGKKLDELTWRDGGGRYDQSAQEGPLYINLSRIPADESEGYVFVSLPTQTPPRKIRDRWILRVGAIWASVLPLGDSSEIVELPLTAKQSAANAKAAAEGREPPFAPRQILRISGRPAGFALVAAEGRAHGHAPTFAAWAESAYKFDLSRFRDDVAVSITTADGRTLTARHDPEGRRAQTTGFTLPTADVVYGGPFVRLANQKLSVTDGTAGYTVDFSGELPVYGELTPTPVAAPEAAPFETTPAPAPLPAPTSASMASVSHSTSSASAATPAAPVSTP